MTALSNIYYVENQWGGTGSPWQAGGAWVIGGRMGQPVTALSAKSTDGAQTLVGKLTYKGEGPIGFRATQTQHNSYIVEVQWGGTRAPWNAGGTWLLGGRAAQSVAAIDISSGDGGRTFTGKMTYGGEGPIGFKGSGMDGGVYEVENKWGGSDAAWNAGGVWVIGSRDRQNVSSIQIASGDDGDNFKGGITYEGEGPIGFVGSFQDGNNYVTKARWGGDAAPWNAGGTWVLGSRADQRAVEIGVTSNDGGRTLEGTMKYAGEGPIGFRATIKNKAK